MEDCKHTVSRAVKRTDSLGRYHFGMQCQRCGFFDAKKKEFITSNYPGYGIFDESIREKWQKKIDEQWEEEREKNRKLYELQQAEREKQQLLEDENWKESYKKYLQTDYWHNFRKLVLKRDNNLCQSCLTAPATAVHHLTYKHFRYLFGNIVEGYENASYLISVCDTCHKKIHGRL